MKRLLQIGSLSHQVGMRTLVMGILNVTPDSFSDGGLYSGADAAEAHARVMIAQGADIIDVGAESTQPGSEKISADVELTRLLPALSRICDMSCAITIDTYKAEVAAAALGAGAHAINDIWGLQGDPDMATVAARMGASVIAMHNRETIDPALDIVADMQVFFTRTLEIAEEAGIDRDRIVLDPGIGFGKTPLQNLIAINHLADLKADFDLPILVGASRKRIIGTVTGRKTDKRDTGSLGAHLVAAAHGADIIRAHEVEMHVDALRMADAICNETLEQGTGE
ncbi:dihydropteroate synthase [Breoghania sp.]|uniref:dihydropteroate synthase n=1 Tax=Breoghania sp. TaxID=2065378 RepID=UPI002624433A|nr:dihydropteroate synthase [Breoghania sp.]MDJ0930360.1 dihydropteroate synthase [Breoghania sp.]